MAVNAYYVRHRAKLLQKNKEPHRHAQRLKHGKERRIKKPIQAAAHIAVSNALLSGKLVKQPCEVCGSLSLIEAHHDDYTKRLEVRWLCKPHHLAVHGRKFYG